MPRLKRVSPDRPGFARRRAGKGWIYFDTKGLRISDREVIDRIAHLAIPPAYREVWISPFANGHIQAVGLDDKDRKQYRYHPDWRIERDRQKHDRILGLARKLPEARQQVARHLALSGMPRDRALATAFRLLELGFFRVGSEAYTAENGSYGLATLRKEHVRVHRDGGIEFDYRAKHGIRRDVVIHDDDVRACVTMMRRRRGGGDELLAWREHGRWHDVTSSDINNYLHDVVDDGVTAKDFRTWHGTVLAAAALAARYDDGSSKTARKKQVVAAMREVAEHLGNTATVARNSYVDPRLVERFDAGQTIAPVIASIGSWDETEHERLEQAVIALIEATDAAVDAEADAAAAQEAADAAQREADQAAERADEAEAEIEEATREVARAET